MVTSETDPGIESNFPAARGDGYASTSPADPDYNCIAWAAGESSRHWWPTPHPVTGVFWPGGVPRKPTLQAFIQAYGSIDYKDCQRDGSLEEGYEKIALYVDANDVPTHAARQLPNGEWTSKLGPYKDIEHTTPAALESSARGDTAYGKVATYMRRERKTAKSASAGTVPRVLPAPPSAGEQPAKA